MGFDQDQLAAPVNIRLAVLPDVDCPYLPGKRETVRGLMASSIDGRTYQAFMDAGFRRSGRFLYQPVCRDCRECVPIRVPVDAFTPTASQRRSQRRNQDLVIAASPPMLTDEKADLYSRYVRDWHGKEDRLNEESIESLRSFLYESPTETLEFTYHDPIGRLLAVGICDVGPASLSSVYFYFDPAERKRSLGTFGAVQEIEWCRENGRSFYYLGYWVRDCAAMAYKANYRPHQLLRVNGEWVAGPS